MEPGAHSDYTSRVEQAIADYNASGDAKYPSNSKELLPTHADSLFGRSEHHLHDMERRRAIGKKYTQEELNLILDSR